VDVYSHVSALAGRQCSVSRPGRFTLGERVPGTHCIGSWVDPRTGLDDLEKRKFLTLPGLELQPLSRPSRSQKLALYEFKQAVRIFSHVLFKPFQSCLLLWRENDLLCPLSVNFSCSSDELSVQKVHMSI
jgi:hypothetical protein